MVQHNLKKKKKCFGSVHSRLMLFDFHYVVFGVLREHMEINGSCNAVTVRRTVCCTWGVGMSISHIQSFDFKG